MIITLDGNLVTVKLDGKTGELDGTEVTRFDSAAKDIPARKTWAEPKRDYPRPTSGYIGLQTHDPGDVVFFKEVSIRPLTEKK
jgi:hypothetical protein